MKINEHLEGLRSAREAAHKKMCEVAQKSVDEQRSMNDAEQQEFDAIRSEIETLDADIKRFSELQAMEAKSAESASQQSRVNAEAKVGDGKVYATARNTMKLDPGIPFARAAKCLALGSLQNRSAVDIAKSIYPDDEGVVKTAEILVTKAAVPAATTTDSTWAGPLIQTPAGVVADFIEFLRPQTIVGRFGAGGVPALRRVPFRTPLVGQTSGGAGYWVGEGKSKPLTKFDFSRTTLDPLKVANIAVATMEVVRDSTPAADVIIRDQLAAALSERLDKDFIDPAKAASAGVSPASILNGLTPIASSGTTADNVRTDLGALFAAFIAANNAPTSGVWIMPATTALSLSLMVNTLGQPEFPGVNLNGGTLQGLPVITSQYVPTLVGPPAGAIVALVNASDIYIGDDGGIDVSMSTEASLQMSDSPVDPPDATAVYVSLWQQNLVGFRAERTINWAKRRASAAAYLDGVAWA